MSQSILQLVLDYDGPSLRIQVRDDGVGLPAGFDIDSTTSLGLSIVRDLVESQLGGTMSMTSTSRNGRRHHRSLRPLHIRSRLVARGQRQRRRTECPGRVVIEEARSQPKSARGPATSACERASDLVVDRLGFLGRARLVLL